MLAYSPAVPPHRSENADHEHGVALTGNKRETALRPMMERPCAIGVLLINGDSPAAKLVARRQLSKQAPEYWEIGLPIAPSGVSNIELDAAVVVLDLPARHSRRDQGFELLVNLRPKGMNVPLVLTASPGHFALRRQPENDAGSGLQLLEVVDVLTYREVT